MRLPPIPPNALSAEQKPLYGIHVLIDENHRD
jgi:hypothetical protein